MFDSLIKAFPWAIYPLFLLGFVLLVKGADWMVEGASAIARRLRISDMVIGLTIVSFGTSMPELVVNVLASWNNNPEIAIGNIVGSNIANVFLILGAAAVIQPLIVRSATIWKEVPLSLLAAVMLFVLLNDGLIDGMPTSALTRGDGMVLMGFFFVFVYYTFGMAIRGEGFEESLDAPMGMGRAVAFTVLGLISLPIGGDWIVRGAVHAARTFHVSESVIGLTIVAIGTSLPELAASVAAAMKGKADIAIGNAVGSNIFNIFWVLGVSALIRPIPHNPVNNPDVAVAALASFLLFLFLLVGRPRILQRSQAILFLVMYAGYLSYLAIVGRSG